MTQKDIMDALQKSLTQGSGSLDDLSNLLTRVQADIEQAKKEEVENKRKAENARGERIAEIATNMLQNQLTPDDMAFIFNEYFHDKHWTGKDISDIEQNMREADKVASNLNTAIDELCETLEQMFGKKNCKCEKPKANVENKKDADEVLKKFLRDFGL